MTPAVEDANSKAVDVVNVCDVGVDVLNCGPPVCDSSQLRVTKSENFPVSKIFVAKLSG